MNELQVILSQIILQFFVRNDSDENLIENAVMQWHEGLNTRVVLYWLPSFSLILIPLTQGYGSQANLIFPVIPLGKSSLNFIFGFVCGKYPELSHEEICFIAI